MLRFFSFIGLRRVSLFQISDESAVPGPGNFSCLPGTFRVYRELVGPLLTPFKDYTEKIPGAEFRQSNFVPEFLSAALSTVGFLSKA